MDKIKWRRHVYIISTKVIQSSLYVYFIQENAGRCLNFVVKLSFENGIYGSSCLGEFPMHSWDNLCLRRFLSIINIDCLLSAVTGGSAISLDTLAAASTSWRALSLSGPMDPPSRKSWHLIHPKETQITLKVIFNQSLIINFFSLSIHWIFPPRLSF